MLRAGAMTWRDGRVFAGVSAGVCAKQILDAPVSWVKRVVIDRRMFADRFPHKKKIIEYKRCLLEKFNEFYPGDPPKPLLDANGRPLPLALTEEQKRDWPPPSDTDQR